MFQGRKTYIAALITLVLGVLAEADWVKVVEDPRGGLGMIGVSLLMVVMRFVTQKTTVKAAEQAPPPDSAG
ncbi:hypothetical protein [Gemmatimonas sp.]